MRQFSIVCFVAISSFLVTMAGTSVFAQGVRQQLKAAVDRPSEHVPQWVTIPAAQPPIVGGENNQLVQFPLHPCSAEYRLQGYGEVTLSFDLTYYEKYNAWELVSQLHAVVKNVDGYTVTSDFTYRSSIDEKANLLKEEISIDDEGNGWLKNGPRSYKKQQRQSLEISTKKHPILGRNKVITFINHNEGDKSRKESMVSVNDVVTSYLQLIAWIGTVKELPENGQMVRWIFDGRPNPALIRQESQGGCVFSIYPAPDREPNYDKCMAQFIYQNPRQGFQFPDIVSLEFSGGNIQLQRVQ